MKDLEAKGKAFLHRAHIIQNIIAWQQAICVDERDMVMKPNALLDDYIEWVVLHAAKTDLANYEFWKRFEFTDEEIISIAKDYEIPELEPMVAGYVVNIVETREIKMWVPKTVADTPQKAVDEIDYRYREGMIRLTDIAPTIEISMAPGSEEGLSSCPSDIDGKVIV